MSFITVSIPAYNDATTIERLIDDSIESVAHITNDFEILVIDDGSRDDTPNILRRVAATKPCVRVLTHQVNQGFGATIGKAYSLPTSQWVYFIPGDAQIPAQSLADLWPLAHEFDLLLALRSQRQDPPRRKVVSWCYNLLVSLVAERRVRDVNSAGLLRRQALDGIVLTAKSGFVHAELLLELIRHGKKFTEIDIQHRPRLAGEGSGNKIRVILSTAFELARYACRKWTGRL